MTTALYGLKVQGKDVPLEGVRIDALLTDTRARVTVVQRYYWDDGPPTAPATFAYMLETGACLKELLHYSRGRVERCEPHPKQRAGVYIRSAKSARQLVQPIQKQPSVFTAQMSRLSPRSTVVVRFVYTLPLLKNLDGTVRFSVPKFAAQQVLSGCVPRKSWKHAPPWSRVAPGVVVRIEMEEQSRRLSCVSHRIAHSDAGIELQCARLDRDVVCALYTAVPKPLSAPTNTQARIVAHIDPEVLRARMERSNTKVPSLRKAVKPPRRQHRPPRSHTRTCTRVKTGRKRSVQPRPETLPAAHKRNIRIDEGISVVQLARELKIKASTLIRDALLAGDALVLHHILDVEKARVIAERYGYTVKDVALARQAQLRAQIGDDNGELEPRDPVVTLMGHVDHGKTSLLDALRGSNVAAQEKGGITQHLGAYRIAVASGAMLTLLDTPGHEAFATLRTRSLQATDIVVLVVAADDGVMPQTLESIRCATEANVPIVVALNKIDKPGANIERTMQMLSGHGLGLEPWGGDVLVVPVSATHCMHLDQLVEAIMLQAELMELKAQVQGQARGWVLESSLDPHRGPVATLLVQHGTLVCGDVVVAGDCYGRVRSMHNAMGQSVECVGPSEPVKISGLSGVPKTDQAFAVVVDGKRAKQMSVQSRFKADAQPKRLSTEERVLHVVLKVDTQGSVDVVRTLLEAHSDEEVVVRVVDARVGQIVEADIKRVSVAPRAVVVGFHVRPTPRAKRLARRENVELVCCALVTELKPLFKALVDQCRPVVSTVEVVGQATVRQLFALNRVGTVAGCTVREGRLRRGDTCRIVRDGVVLGEGHIQSLKHWKEEVREVSSGIECGVRVARFEDLEVGDTIEAVDGG